MFAASMAWISSSDVLVTEFPNAPKNPSWEFVILSAMVKFTANDIRMYR